MGRRAVLVVFARVFFDEVVDVDFGLFCNTCRENWLEMKTTAIRRVRGRAGFVCFCFFAAFFRECTAYSWVKT